MIIMLSGQHNADGTDEEIARRCDNDNLVLHSGYLI